MTEDDYSWVSSRPAPRPGYLAPAGVNQGEPSCVICGERVDTERGTQVPKTGSWAHQDCVRSWAAHLDG